MIVPQYWAESRVQEHRGGRQFTVRRFGWSDLSQEDAQRNANARADEALRRVLAGEKLPRREPKVAYNGGAGVPIREEILARHGETVVTRNTYGAHCLNSPDVLFVDIDYARGAPMRWHAVTALLWLLLVIVAWRQLSGLALFMAVLAIGVAYALLTALADRWRRRHSITATEMRVRRFAAQRPSWGLRLYRTPAGLRVLVTHAAFRPDAAETTACFDALGADARYAALCRNQQCFRARLTGKPWRMGIAGHLGPRPAIWPVPAEHLPQREQWTRHYDAVAAGYSACAFLYSLGSSNVAAAVAPTLELHDSACRAHEPLPLA
ncbi:hypothetical protein [Tahibacter harae]|uniref:Transmembrane protein n=1 Tax=Tahibacter harae TaxID=2963937 RepID=A0ABT1QYP1_9GAMM|nr:hypothetical protein [Tahibacter harae]MCQ4167410.1 hypothetical protein [Tahibacter harae]